MPAVRVGDAVGVREGGRLRDVRRVVRRVHESPANHDHHQDDRHLQHHDHAVDERRFLGAANQQRGEQEEDDDGRDIDDAMHAADGICLERGMTPLIGDVHAHHLERLVEVLAPRDRDRRRADGVLEHEVPADDPGHQLAHRRVRIGVGAAGDRDHRRELGVAEAGEGAAEAGDHEREGHRRTGALGDRRRGPDEEAGADDGADAEGDQRPRPEGALEAGLAALAAVGHEAVNRLGPKQ